MSKRSRRILMSLGVLVLLCIAYVWLFGFQTATKLQARWIANKAPVVKLTPRNLPTLSIAAGPGMRLAYFGYEFEVPWDDLDESTIATGPTWVVLRFRSGHVLKFTSVPPLEFVNVVSEQTNKEVFREIYGQAPLQSDYAMWSLLLNATPDKVKLFADRKESVGTSMLLVIKAIAMPEESGVFSLHTNNFKGFQWGDPQAQPKRIVADLFADDRGLEFSFSGPGKGKALVISQLEINRVLQSVRKINQSKAEEQRAAALPY